jgi:hypothetical protein
MFEGRNIGLSIARGWLPLFETLCEQIDTVLGADKLGFHWVQCKEKFGSARFYWETEQHAPIWVDAIQADGVLSLVTAPHETKHPDSVKLGKIHQLVSTAQGQTQKICIVCGIGPAKSTLQKGYYLVLCEDHADAWQRGRALRPSPWFDPSDDLP